MPRPPASERAAVNTAKPQRSRSHCRRHRRRAAGREPAPAPRVFEQTVIIATYDKIATQPRMGRVPRTSAPAHSLRSRPRAPGLCRCINFPNFGCRLRLGRCTSTRPTKPSTRSIHDFHPYRRKWRSNYSRVSWITRYPVTVFVTGPQGFPFPINGPLSRTVRSRPTTSRNGEN